MPVPPDDPDARGSGPRDRVVVGIDGSGPSMDALRWAVAQASSGGLTLDIVHVRVVRKVVSELIVGAEAEEEEILEQAVATARALAPDLEVHGYLEDPPAAGHLVEASRGAALLVVGSRGLGGFKELMLGSVSQQCVHHAHCPVLVVRPEPEVPAGPD